MQRRIEPPILISRLMTFVMATALVVLGVLVFTFNKMFPIERPQVFLLNTQRLEDKKLIVSKISDTLSDEDIDVYKQLFVREYVRERNEIVPDIAVMRAKWANDDSAIIRARSTDRVFGKFTETDMVNAIMNDQDEPFNIQCNVQFPKNYSVVSPAGADNTVFDVHFKYICFQTQNPEISDDRDVYVRIKLQPIDKNKIKWAGRTKNPLGLMVSDYIIPEGQNDPLDSGVWQ